MKLIFLQIISYIACKGWNMSATLLIKGHKKTNKVWGSPPSPLSCICIWLDPRALHNAGSVDSIALDHKALGGEQQRPSCLASSNSQQWNEWSVTSPFFVKLDAWNFSLTWEERKENTYPVLVAHTAMTGLVECNWVSACSSWMNLHPEAFGKWVNDKIWQNKGVRSPNSITVYPVKYFRVM